MFNDWWISIYFVTQLNNINTFGVYGTIVSKKDKHDVFQRSIGSSRDCNLSQTQTDFSADVAQDISTTCHCVKETRKCYNKLNWKYPLAEHDVIGYHIVLYKVPSIKPSCFKVPSNQREFIFNEKRGFDRNFMYNFGVIPEPVKGLPVYNTYTIDCPSHELYILRHLPNVHINIGGNYVFNCTFTGYPKPEPDDITWKFEPSLKTVNQPKNLHNKHITITKRESTTTLKIASAVKAHEGRYTCFIKNYFGKCDSSNGYLHVNGGLHVQNQRNKTLGWIIGGIIGGILLLVALYTISKCFTKPKKPVIGRKMFVYISHCTPDENQKKKLLNFASYLQFQLTGVTVIMDLIKENEINQAGGMSQWVPQQICNADKILVVLSDDYLKVLDQNQRNDNDDENVCKIHTEYNHMKKIVYESCQITYKLIIVSDNVKPTDFPNIFYGRSYYLMPKNVENSEQVSKLIRMLSVLANQDILQHPNPKKIENSILFLHKESD